MSDYIITYLFPIKLDSPFSHYDFNFIFIYTHHGFTKIFIHWAISLVEKADKKDIRLASLSRYFTGSPPREGLVLGFGSLSLEDLEDGLTILLGMLNDRKLLEK